MTVKLVYFSWVRERIGKSGEEIAVPRHVVTIGDLIRHLSTLGEEYAEALKAPEIIRAAIDQEHVDHSEPLGRAREVALFPPMTGG
jgi:molybdopterin converting factor, subunit 1, non-archaeal